MKKIKILILFLWLIVNTGEGAEIKGVITDKSGRSIENADVYIYGTDKWTKTDNWGYYILTGLTPAAPRYIICAEKEGYFIGRKGNINVKEDESVNVNLVLEKLKENESYKTQILDVRLCYLIDHKKMEQEPIQPAENALLDPSLYPDSVKPYLKSGKYMDKENPKIKALAQEILSSVPQESRTNQTEIAKAVYLWVVENIDYDLMKRYPDDVTCGNWQTVNRGWGKNFAEWCYLPQEVVKQRRAICIEYERLTTTLLRALNIPARPAPLKAHPVTQWWVQLPNGSGYWANMETSRGHIEYEKGNTYAGFPSRADHQIAFWWPNADAPIHNDWAFNNPCLWREVTGAGHAKLEHNATGLSQAQKLLEEFRQIGRIKHKGAPIKPAQPNYEIYTRGFQVDLSTIEEQKKIRVYFPLFINNEYNTTVDYAFWTNHPEWVEKTWGEILTDKKTQESLPIFYIDFSLEPVKLKEPELKNADFEEGTNVPYYWEKLSIPPGNTIFFLSNDAKNGKFSACIENLTNGISAFYQTIPVEEGDVIRIDGWIKLKNVQGLGNIEVIFSGNYDNIRFYQGSYPMLSGTQGWTKVWGSFFVLPGTDSVSIRCILTGKGKVWFDDIRLLSSTRQKKSTKKR
ncbi:MAG: carboxypeptidase regulatory-like domain-containing protein [Candidatus Aminicenantia bacterium]